MKEYFETMFSVSCVIGIIAGVYKWILLLLSAANAGETAWVIVYVVLGEIIIPLNAIMPGLIYGGALTLVCLPFYAIYRLVKNK